MFSSDLVLYSTPPITFASVVDYLKQCDHAKTYLLLKETFFLKNAVDIGCFPKVASKRIAQYAFGKRKRIFIEFRNILLHVFSECRLCFGSNPR